MKKIIFLGLIIILIFLIGCFQKTVTCNEPYIVKGTDCCIDLDKNKLCDKDEKFGEEIIDYKDVKEEIAPSKTLPILDNLGKVCNVILKEFGEGVFTEPEDFGIIDCSSDQDCVNRVVSLASKESPEMKTSEIMEALSQRMNITCAYLTQEQKEYITKKEADKIFVGGMYAGSEYFHFEDKCYWDGSADVENRAYFKATNVRVKPKFKFGGEWVESKEFQTVGDLQAGESKNINFYMEFDCPQSHTFESVEWIKEYD